MIATDASAPPIGGARTFDRQAGLIGALLILLTAAVRLVPAWLLQAEVADVVVYRTMAGYVLRGDNIYAQRVLFPYTPFSQFLPAWSLQLAGATGLRFDLVIKLLCTVSDSATTALIVGYLLWRGLSLAGVVGWGLAWALNPISILVTAFHGNMMVLVPFFIVGAFVLTQLADASADGPDRWLLLALAALLLGIAIGLRTFPILALPFFLLLVTRTVREVAVFAALALLPATLSTIPYLILARETFLAEVLGYGGFSDFGWVSVLRAAGSLARGTLIIGSDGALLDLTKRLFLVGYAVVVAGAPFFRPSSLGRALLLAPLLFYALYGGVSAQYLIWAVPIAIVCRDRSILPFSVAGTLAMISFYALYASGILFGRFPAPAWPASGLLWLYAAGNVLVVLLSAIWATRIVIVEWRAYRAGAWATEARWLRRVRPIWANRAYLLLPVGLSVVWLVVLARCLERAREVLPVLTG